MKNQENKNTQKQKGNKTTRTDLDHNLKNLVSNCNNPGLVHEIKTLILAYYNKNWAFSLT